MDEFKFVFQNGSVIKIVLGEDGYNVSIIQDIKPLMGTFTDFRNLLKGIGEFVTNNVINDDEFDKFSVELDLSISNTMVVDEIKEILLTRQ